MALVKGRGMLLTVSRAFGSTSKQPLAINLRCSYPLTLIEGPMFSASSQQRQVERFKEAEKIFSLFATFWRQVTVVCFLFNPFFKTGERTRYIRSEIIAAFWGTRTEFLLLLLWVAFGVNVSMTTCMTSFNCWQITEVFMKEKHTGFELYCLWSSMEPLVQVAAHTHTW